MHASDVDTSCVHIIIPQSFVLLERRYFLVRNILHQMPPLPLMFFSWGAGGVPENLFLLPFFFLVGPTGDPPINPSGFGRTLGYGVEIK